MCSFYRKRLHIKRCSMFPHSIGKRVSFGSALKGYFEEFWFQYLLPGASTILLWHCKMQPRTSVAPWAPAQVFSIQMLRFAPSAVSELNQWPGIPVQYILLAPVLTWSQTTGRLLLRLYLFDRVESKTGCNQMPWYFAWAVVEQNSVTFSDWGSG